MKLSRLLKLFTTPLYMVYAYLYPVSYAKKIGVSCHKDLKIYGPSYYMFSAEPYLVTLGKNVHISREASFVCHDGSTLPFRKDIPDLELAAEIKVGNNIFIGTGAIILAGVTIGDNSVVGARAVVTKDVPSGSIVAGNPARVIKTTKDFIEQAKIKSLNFGHLTGKDKIAAYKNYFNKI